MTPKQIGALIRATRKLQGLRQDELAAVAGVGLRFLVELEAGKATAQLGKTLAVLAALGCAIHIKPETLHGFIKAIIGHFPRLFFSQSVFNLCFHPCAMIRRCVPFMGSQIILIFNDITQFHRSTNC